jgi:hypothetical protein
LFKNCKITNGEKKDIFTYTHFSILSTCELIHGCNPPIHWALLIEAEVDTEKELKYEFLTFLSIREHL